MFNSKKKINEELNKLNDKVDMLYRIMKYDEPNKINFKNCVEWKTIEIEKHKIEKIVDFVYIYKDKKEYKIDGLSLYSPEFELVSKDILKIVNNEPFKNVYFIDLKTSKQVKEETRYV